MNNPAPINLSILDFKGPVHRRDRRVADTINLSILDFKDSIHQKAEKKRQSYKSIHIGF